jgi:hypothetical protein
MYINVVDGWLYYSDVGRGGDIWRMRLDGSSPQKLGIIGTHLNVHNEWIYYNNRNGAICRARLDGSGQETLVRYDCLSITIAGDWIYFEQVNGPGKITYMRMRTDGSEWERIRRG